MQSLMFTIRVIVPSFKFDKVVQFNRFEIIVGDFNDTRYFQLNALMTNYCYHLSLEYIWYIIYKFNEICTICQESKVCNLDESI